MFGQVYVIAGLCLCYRCMFVLQVRVYDYRCMFVLQVWVDRWILSGVQH